MLNFLRQSPESVLPLQIGDEIPSLEDVSPDYTAHIARQEKLSARRSAAIVELRAIAESDGYPPPVDDTSDDARKKRVSALLDGVPIATPTEEVRYSKQYWNLKREIEDIDEAREILEIEIRKTSDSASAVIRERVRERHRALVRATAAALRELHTANAEYWELADALSKKGVSWGALGVAFVRQIGHPNDRESPIGYWFREALKDGHITRNEIPESLR